MNEEKLTPIAMLKKFFDDPPLTNQELIDFRKNDRQGYDEVVKLVQEHYSQK